MKNLAIILLVAILGVVSGCNLIPTRPYKAEVAQDFPDGSHVDVGDQVYVNKDGDATGFSADPDTGEPNGKLPEVDVDKVAGMQKAADGVAGSLPPPLNIILKIALGVGFASGIAGLAIYRRKKLKDAGVELPPEEA